MSVFWDVRRVVWQKFADVSEKFASIVRAMMEALSTSETSVSFYETARRNIPQGCYLHTRRRENLNSHLILSQ
jgi:hypothetical protein